jgi:hypothetical protein
MNLSFPKTDDNDVQSAGLIFEEKHSISRMTVVTLPPLLMSFTLTSSPRTYHLKKRWKYVLIPMILVPVLLLPLLFLGEIGNKSPFHYNFQ